MLENHPWKSVDGKGKSRNVTTDSSLAVKYFYISSDKAQTSLKWYFFQASSVRHGKHIYGPIKIRLSLPVIAYGSASLLKHPGMGWRDMSLVSGMGKGQLPIEYQSIFQLAEKINVILGVKLCVLS